MDELILRLWGVQHLENLSGKIVMDALWPQDTYMYMYMHSGWKHFLASTMGMKGEGGRGEVRRSVGEGYLHVSQTMATAQSNKGIYNA